MIAIPRVARAAAAVAISLALVVVPVTTATAAVEVATASTATPDPRYSANGIRKWIINVTGSVLGASMPKGWRREQIANEYRYNHSWEQWEAEMGIPGDIPDGQLITDGYLTTPQTKSDYDLRKAEQGLKGGSKGGPLKVPATKPGPLTKVGAGVGGLLTAITGFSFGTMIGSGVADLFGFGDDGIVCSQGEVGKFLSVITGDDCDAWALAQDYFANQDVDMKLQTSYVCVNADGKERCARITGTIIEVNGRTSYCVDGKTNGVQGNLPFGGSPSGSNALQIKVRGSWGWYDDFNYALITRDPCNAPSSFYQYGSQPSGAIEGIRYQGRPEALLKMPDPDPQRQLSCSITGDNGQTYTGTSVTYTEGTGLKTPQCPGLPPGVEPVNVKVNETGPSGTKTVSDQPVTPEYTEWAGDYPECKTGACKLDLLIKDDGPAKKWKSCFDHAPVCLNWFEEANKQDKYQCRYGVHNIELKECYVYAGTFNPARTEVGAAYSDPMTGEWSGGQNAPKPDQQSFAQGIQDPTAIRSCNGMNVTSFDPVGFVMRPIQCALEWAFVPRPAVVEAAAVQTGLQFTERAPGQIATMVGSWQVNPVMTGCKITTAWREIPVEVVNACPGSALAPIATISRAVTAVGFAVMVVVLLRRMVAGTVDYKGN